MAFQESMGLEIDGVAGSETMKKLMEPPRKPGTLRFGDEGDDVVKLQNALKDKEFYRGPVNGKFGPLTEEAVKKFQHANGLEVDGIVGKATLDALNAPKKSAAQTQNTGSASAADAAGTAGAKPAQIAPNGVELVEWTEVKKIFDIGKDTRIYDVRSGAVYYVRGFSNGNHADVEPITTDDTDIMKNTFGGVWSWTPRPVWVTINGRTIAGSINGMPHGGGVNNSNGMEGQICLHFRGSSAHNGNDAYTQLHQDVVTEAWNAAK
jgi:hypothetical protein